MDRPAGPHGEALSALQWQALVDAARQSPAAGDAWLWNRLLAADHVSESMLVPALDEHFGVSVLTDEELARASCAPVAAGQDAWRVDLPPRQLLLLTDPWSARAAQLISLVRDVHVRFALARPGQLECLRSGHQGHRASAVSAAQGAQTPSTDVVQIVDEAISQAYADGASDIHFESARNGMRLKFRLDGVMLPGPQVVGSNLAEQVISRIKVMGQLDITERRRPQDGRIRWQRTSHEGLDLRVSIMPSIFGEDAVLRLLDKAQLRNQASEVTLDALGFGDHEAQQIRRLAARPHGMLLVTGPTGSGKTTTVYAALSEVNSGLDKIITIEDPVEYELPGVLQIPVNEQKGLTFATGLRSILRHDPDKILVGEIRDAETAQIAVQSSLTGHLVFTTVHANSLFDVLGRFRHLGIEPFALASALNGVVVQRLLRRLCPHCVQWRPLTAEEGRLLEAEGLPAPEQVPVARGCGHCRDSGYKGRLVLAEVHVVVDAVRDMMLSGGLMTDFKKVVYGDGSRRLLAQAVQAVAQGRTSMEEVSRVVGLG